MFIKDFLWEMLILEATGFYLSTTSPQKWWFWHLLCTVYCNYHGHNQLYSFFRDIIQESSKVQSQWSLKACPHQETLFGNNVCKQFANSLQTVCKLFANSLQTVCEHCFQTVCKLFGNCLQTVCKLFANNISHVSVSHTEWETRCVCVCVCAVSYKHIRAHETLL